MAGYTKSYNLKKPEPNDFVDVSDINGNMDIIDSTLKQHNNNIHNLEKSQKNKADLENGKIPSSQLPDMDFVPTARTVNKKALSEDIELTAEDVGAAAANHSHSDYVPTTRTVNNKALSEDITLSASDVGAAATSHTHSDYVPTSRTVNNKPLSSNITLSASDVGAAATNHTHSDIPKPNLLHNWFFGDPVNQRRLSTYDDMTSSSAYTIDRWKRASNMMVSVSSDYVTISPSSSASTVSSWLFYQDLDTKALAGKTCTASILLKGATDPTNNLAFSISDGKTYYRTRISNATNGNGVLSQKMTFSEDATIARVGVRIYGNDSVTPGLATAVNIVAMKLEIGDHQTLAHQEGSDWVLNEIPDYTEELQKCQRYQTELTTSIDKYYGFVGSGVGNGTTTTNIFVPLPASLRARPAVSFSGKWYLGSSGWNDYTVTNITLNRIASNGVVLNVTTAAAIPTNQPVMLVYHGNDQEHSLLLDANV